MEKEHLVPICCIELLKPYHQYIILNSNLKKVEHRYMMKMKIVPLKTVIFCKNFEKRSNGKIYIFSKQPNADFFGFYFSEPRPYNILLFLYIRGWESEIGRLVRPAGFDS